MESRQRLQSTEEERATAEAELNSMNEEQTRYAPHAPFAGTLRDLDPDLKPGQWVGKQEKLALLVGQHGQIVETYLDEDAIKAIALGDGGIFLPEGGDGPGLALSVSNIDSDASRVLLLRQLGTQAGGHVLTRDRKMQRVPERAFYRVILKVDAPHDELSGQSWRGKVVIRGRWQAPAERYLRNVLAVLVREAGL